MSQALAEIERRLANVLRPGTVKARQGKLVQVESGGIVTDWLPWFTMRAGHTRTWSAPRVGEQGFLLSPGGDTSEGAFLLGLYQDAHDAPSSDDQLEITEYPDGTTLTHNSASNTYTLTVAGAGLVVVNCKQAQVNAETSATLNTPDTHCTGNLRVDGSITYGQGMTGSGGANITGNFAATGGTFTHNGKNVGHNHTHLGVVPGGGTSGAPV